MKTCDDCLYKYSIYCDIETQKKQGFCNNYSPKHIDDTESEDK